MASSVGHSICGIACYLAARRLNPDIAVFHPAKGALLFIFLANLPDGDLLLGYLFASNPLQYHWGFTHTVWFILLAGILIGGVMKATERLSVFAWSMLVFAVASHVAIDLITGSQWGMHPSYGLKLFWPVFDVRITSPISLFLGVKHELSYFLSGHNLLAVMIDIFVFSPVVMALTLTSKKRRGACR